MPQFRSGKISELLPTRSQLKRAGIDTCNQKPDNKTSDSHLLFAVIFSTMCFGRRLKDASLGTVWGNLDSDRAHCLRLAPLEGLFNGFSWPITMRHLVRPLPHQLTQR